MVRGAHVMRRAADVLILIAIGAYTLFSVAWMASGIGHALPRLHGWNAVAVGSDYLFSQLNLALGGFLLWRRPADRTAQLMAIGMIGTAAAFNLQGHATWDVPGTTLRMLHIALHHVGAGVAYVLALLFVPDGRSPWPALSRARSRAAATVCATVVGSAAYGASRAGTAGFVLLFGALIPLAGILAQISRRRSGHARGTHLVEAALAPALVAGAVLSVVLLVIRTGGWDLDPAALKALVFRVLSAPFAVIPVVLFIGILRYRLWGIEFVVRKTFLYGSLAGFVTAAYLVAVVAAGRAAGSRGELWTAVAAASVVGIAFQPLRDRLEQLADRLVFGPRAEPFAALAALTRRLASSAAVDDVLAKVAETASTVSGGPAGVTVHLPGGGLATAYWPPGERMTPHPAVAIVHQGTVVGELALAERIGSRLLAGLTSQAGLALANARLDIELRERLEALSEQAHELDESHRRLADARAEERARFAREVSASVEAGLASAASTLERTVTHEALDEAARHASTALDALRDIARRTFPTLLHAHGLAPAVEAFVRRRCPSAAVEVSLDRGVRFEPEAESAVYFACLEAVLNAARHADASTVRIVLHAADGTLAFTVADDGRGFDPSHQGTGLRVMRDRLEALGGSLELVGGPGSGTIVSGIVPARVTSAPAPTGTAAPL